MTEVLKVFGLHNTGLTMHERFTLLARQGVGRRRASPAQARLRAPGRPSHPLVDLIVNQLNQGQTPIPGIPFRGRGRGRGRGGLRRAGSEGSLWSLPGLRRARSNSFGPTDQLNNNQKWRRSNSNLSYAGSMNGSVRSVSTAASRGYWVRGNANQPRGVRGRGRGRGRARGFRGRVHQGRVNRPTAPMGGPPRPARGSGRRGLRRNTGPHAARGQPRGRGRAHNAGFRGRGGISRGQQNKPVPTKEELDAQLDQYMSGTKTALDKELDEYMRNVDSSMDFE